MSTLSSDPDDYTLTWTTPGQAKVTDKHGHVVGWVSMMRTVDGPRWTMSTYAMVRTDVSPPELETTARGALRAWLARYVNK